GARRAARALELVKQRVRLNRGQELAEVTAHPNGCRWHEASECLSERDEHPLCPGAREPALQVEKSRYVRSDRRIERDALGVCQHDLTRLFGIVGDSYFEVARAELGP